MDKRVDDMLKISDINNKILEFYHELAELEKEGQIDSPLYEDICYAISYRKKEAKGLLYNYPLNDDYIDTYIDFSKKFDENRNPNHKTMELYDFASYLYTSRYRRLYELIKETSYFFHIKLKDNDDYGEFDNQLFINGEVFDLDSDMDDLIDEGYDPNILQEYKELVEETEIENIHFSNARDKYMYACIQLESTIFMNYLLEAIEAEKNTKVKNRLIDVKYNLIYTISFLEDAFLSNHSIKNSIDHYHAKLDFIFKRDRCFYPEFIEKHINKAKEQQDRILERNKTKYNNTDERVLDILEGIMIKTHLSCIPDQDVRKEIVDDQKIAVELSESKIDKKVLKKSLQLNKNFVINNNYN